MSNDGGMTLAQCKAFSMKHQREQAERTALLVRLRAAETTLSQALDSLAYLQQYVAGVEALVADLLAEERACRRFGVAPSCGSSSWKIIACGRRCCMGHFRWGPR